MKNFLLFLLIISVLSVLNPAYSQESISMGAGYAYDVYYSMEDGVIAEEEREGWDIGFYTIASSAGIITNGGMEVELYTYPNGDTTAWMNIDTNGLSMWPKLFNGEDSWENGAFNRNSHGYPDAGWGIYNISTNDIVGDSIYIIKLADGTFKQLWIVKKISDENKYVIKYANLNNSSAKEKTLDVDNFLGMNFAYFEFESGTLFDREPETYEWDILFTKYQAMLPQGVPFSVVGVLNNVNTPANRFHPVTLDFNDWFTQPLDPAKAVIGYNWKWFDLGSFQWNLEDSLLFFVNGPNGNIYKIYFTFYEGTSTGNIEFEQEVVSMVDISDLQENMASIRLLPNPADNMVTVTWNHELNRDADIRIFNIIGKEVMFRSLGADAQSRGGIRLDISSLHEGMYIVSIISGGTVVNEKLVVR